MCRQACMRACSAAPRNNLSFVCPLGRASSRHTLRGATLPGAMPLVLVKVTLHGVESRGRDRDHDHDHGRHDSVVFTRNIGIPEKLDEFRRLLAVCLTETLADRRSHDHSQDDGAHARTCMLSALAGLAEYRGNTAEPPPATPPATRTRYGANEAIISPTTTPLMVAPPTAGSVGSSGSKACQSGLELARLLEVVVSCMRHVRVKQSSSGKWGNLVADRRGDKGAILFDAAALRAEAEGGGHAHARSKSRSDACALKFHVVLKPPKTALAVGASASAAGAETEAERAAAVSEPPTPVPLSSPVPAPASHAAVTQLNFDLASSPKEKAMAQTWAGKSAQPHDEPNEAMARTWAGGEVSSDRFSEMRRQCEEKVGLVRLREVKAEASMRAALTKTCTRAASGSSPADEWAACLQAKDYERADLIAAKAHKSAKHALKSWSALNMTYTPESPGGHARLAQVTVKLERDVIMWGARQDARSVADQSGRALMSEAMLDQAMHQAHTDARATPSVDARDGAATTHNEAPSTPDQPAATPRANCSISPTPKQGWASLAKQHKALVHRDALLPGSPLAPGSKIKRFSPGMRSPPSGASPPGASPNFKIPSWQLAGLDPEMLPTHGFFKETRAAPPAASLGGVVLSPGFLKWRNS